MLETRPEALQINPTCPNLPAVPLLVLEVERGKVKDAGVHLPQQAANDAGGQVEVGLRHQAHF